MHLNDYRPSIPIQFAQEVSTLAQIKDFRPRYPSHPCALGVLPPDEVDIFGGDSCGKKIKALKINQFIV